MVWLEGLRGEIADCGNSSERRELQRPTDGEEGDGEAPGRRRGHGCSLPTLSLAAVQTSVLNLTFEMCCGMQTATSAPRGDAQRNTWWA